jgi:hypothetical protein
MVLLCMVSCVVMINNGHIGLHYLRNLKRKANETTNNLSGTAAGIGGSVCVNRLRPVESGGGGMKDEALKLALEALEAHADIGIKSDKAITAIKQALAAPVQEPVAWRYTDSRGHYRYRGYVPGFDVEYSLLKPQALYTTPPAAQRQWVGLTAEDKLHIEIMGGKSDVMLAEMVEAKLKERNT